MDYLNRFETWRKEESIPQQMRAELDAMVGNDEAIKGAFGAELAFGTAGIRGIMGAGTNRLNEFTVRRMAQGLTQWLLDSGLPARCAIAYDSRHNSRFFAEICATVLADSGVKVHLYHELAPTPMLSYAVRELHCGCGIVVSASHNAGIYNGIKCYGPDGCQMTDEPAKGVYERIERIAYFTPCASCFDKLVSDGRIAYIPLSLWEAYYETVLAQGVQLADVPKAALKVLYTPLCGTGNKPVREVLKRIGVTVDVVKVQEQPDGDFKTCEYPNPETDAALNESYKLARSADYDLILGTDPDCDRVAIAVPTDGGFRKLSGNELGCMLLDYILGKSERLPQDAECVRSIVSTSMADRIAAHYGCRMKTVLTGFKYIGGEILRLEQEGKQEQFVFGFEESCGYLKGTYARDKDAVVASMLVCEMAASLKREGKTILQHLNELYAQYGAYLAKVQSIELKGVDAMQQAAAFMVRVRENTPNEVAGLAVTQVNDYQRGIFGLPKSNVVEWILGDAARLIFRPSGTEPKVKIYYTAIGKTEEESKAMMDALWADVAALTCK